MDKVANFSIVLALGAALLFVLTCGVVFATSMSETLPTTVLTGSVAIL